MNRLPEHPGQQVSASDADLTLSTLAQQIKEWGRELGFGAVGISDADLSQAEAGLAAWLEAGYHGEMDYMAKHAMKRARPAELVAGTLRVITVRMAYLPASTLNGKALESDASGVSGLDWREREWSRIGDPSAAVVSVYARGRDYHKVLRNRLQQLSDRIEKAIGVFGYRVFTDSAPVLEVELAQRAGNGWRGKHTLLLQRDAGSLFFIGEILVDIPLPPDSISHPETAPEENGAHCGSCSRCITACPTGAIVAPYRLDARRCISYLTIELKGSIPEELRPLIGNRVYGCDDCQLVCPWNKFAQAAPVADFDVRHGLDRSTLIDLFSWTEIQFDDRMQGSAIRRIGHAQWLRNIAVAMGNALRSPDLSDSERAAIRVALGERLNDAPEMVREHIEWALHEDEQGKRDGTD